MKLRAAMWKWLVLLVAVVVVALALFAYGYVHDWGCDPHGQYDRGDRCYVG